MGREGEERREEMKEMVREGVGGDGVFQWIFNPQQGNFDPYKAV